MVKRIFPNKKTYIEEVDSPYLPMKVSEQIPNDRITGKDIETITGLSDVEAQKRLKDEGYNELPSQKRQNTFVI
jgi:hypothetical protein